MTSIEIYQILLPLGESLTVWYGNNIVLSQVGIQAIQPSKYLVV